MCLSVSRFKQQGVTLIELMVVISLVAIFAVMALPAMGDMITRQRVKSDAATVVSALTSAQVEAIRRNQPVYVVPGKIKIDGKLDGTADSWDNTGAILVFADGLNTPGQKTGLYDTGESLRLNNLSKKVTVTVTARTVDVQDNDKAGFSTKKMGFIFQSNGQVKMKPDFTAAGMGDAGYIGRIVIADKANPQKYCRVIRVESLGRAAVCDDKASHDKDNKFCYCGKK